MKHLFSKCIELVEQEGSTKLLGILRIVLTSLFMVRFSSQLRLFGNLTNKTGFILPVLFFVAGPLLIVGFRGWISRGLMLVTVGWMASFALDGSIQSWAHHHTRLHFISMFLLCISPCTQSFSWDALRKRQKGEATMETGRVFPQTLLALSLTAVYWYGAYDKLNLPFLSGARMTHHLAKQFTGFATLDIPYIETLMLVMSISVVALELALPFLLFSKRFWILGVIAGSSLHIGMYIALPVSTFSALTIALYLAFLNPNVLEDHT